MKHTRMIVFLALAVLILTPGCFQVQQELWHNANGSGKLAINMAISETFFQQAGGGLPLWFWLLLGTFALIVIGLVVWFFTWPRTMPAPLLPPAQPVVPEDLD